MYEALNKQTKTQNAVKSSYAFERFDIQYLSRGDRKREPKETSIKSRGKREKQSEEKRQKAEKGKANRSLRD